MAKRIKVIKCPQCGSTKAKELRTDHYQCKSCYTEFFIDSDDINILHKYDSPLGDLNKVNTKRILAGIAIVVSIFIFFGVFSNLFLQKSSFDYAPPSLPVKIEEKEVVFWDRIHKFKGFANATDEGTILVIGTRETKKGYSVSDKKQSYYGIYQAVDGKEILVQPIRSLEETEISNTDVKLFENGDIYAIINKKKLFKLNRATYELEEIIFEALNFSDLAKGVYEIKFAYDGDGFKVVNELGKELYYYPIINKVFGEDMLYKMLPRKTPEARKKVAFQFTCNSDFFPDEKIQLIRYDYWQQIGYPTDIPHFAWTKDFGGSGIFTESSPYRKVLVLPYIAEMSRLISYRDFTPDRDYISGTVWAYDDSQVLISFKPSLSGNSIIQLLDAETAAIKWTKPADMDYLLSEDVVKVKGGYLFTANKESWLFNTQNKEGVYIKWEFDN
ncbi:hypothetical protein [Tannerella forsythia]|uniref:hypothetical protein n=1 Tax=Tannerella forsythia TaxID=28112 RepID=UPI001FE584D3|nr:hypothetical protein [Tannerella forsythia]